ncbi:putative lipid II flippase MurJ [Candidatus Desulfarcum epimagneticum]|uniref:Probable lipid II flippase MurJ n=1 Tax=uncultured Desulfobacteraceae bacterium TaxID=218296 RepID=A0A484HKQ3_9BACT|nr:putative lipid II flippase MurJ [uncultured Desulfobacteraceae bacterium]
MTENSKVTKAAGIVGSATLLSRVMGYIRDMALAWFFGAGMASDAFFVAFRIPNLLRRLFAEGSLSVAFIPVFTDYLEKEGKEEAMRFAGSALKCLSVILAAVALAGVLLAPFIARAFAPGFMEDPEKLRLTTLLTRVMFPYILFIGLVALCMGILNVMGHFAAPALAPVLLNLSMIGAVFLISPGLEEPAMGLAIGVLIGGALQLALQAPFVIRKGVRLGRRIPLRHPGLKKVGVLMLPTILGSAAYQVNILAGTLLSSLLPEGSVSYLYYADRLTQFPLGIFAIALATAVLPSLSRQVSAGDMEAAGQTFSHAMRFVWFITLPAMFGMMALREPIVALLFKRGAFDARAVESTAHALLFYSAGLWAFSGVRIVVSAFYALKDTRTPVKMAVISIAANIILGAALMGPMGHGGLALATSLSSMLNLILLTRALRAKFDFFDRIFFTVSSLKILVSSLVMGGAVFAMSRFVLTPGQDDFSRLLTGILICVAAGSALYALLAFALKSREMKTILQMAGKDSEK